MSVSRIGFTQRESEIMIAAFLSHHTPYDVDYERLATLGGFKNAASARACFAPVKKKIEASIASCPSTGSATSGSGASPSPRAKKFGGDATKHSRHRITKKRKISTQNDYEDHLLDGADDVADVTSKSNNTKVKEELNEEE